MFVSMINGKNYGNYHNKKRVEVPALVIVVSCLPVLWQIDQPYTRFWLRQNCYCLIIICNQFRVRQFSQF